MWGGVQNVARNIARECACSWGFPPKERALLEMLARWIMAMPYLLKAHLRKVKRASAQIQIQGFCSKNNSVSLSRGFKQEGKA